MTNSSILYATINIKIISLPNLLKALLNMLLFCYIFYDTMPHVMILFFCGMIHMNTWDAEL